MTGQTQTPGPQAAIAALCAQYHVVSMHVFGSQARAVYRWVTGGEAVPLAAGHDVDIGVKMARDRRLAINEKVTLALALEDLFGVARVDLVVLDEADPFLAANIIRGERLYIADKRAADEYELYVLRRAADLAPFERERIRMILEGGG